MNNPFRIQKYFTLFLLLLWIVLIAFLWDEIHAPIGWYVSKLGQIGIVDLKSTAYGTKEVIVSALLVLPPLCMVFLVFSIALFLSVPIFVVICRRIGFPQAEVTESLTREFYRVGLLRRWSNWCCDRIYGA